jgi:hypothetical protein
MGGGETLRSTTLILVSILVFATVITTTWGIVTFATADQGGEEAGEFWCEHMDESYHDAEEHDHHHDANPEVPNEWRHHMGEMHANGHCG